MFLNFLQTGISLTFWLLKSLFSRGEKKNVQSDHQIIPPLLSFAARGKKNIFAKCEMMHKTTGKAKPKQM